MSDGDPVLGPASLWTGTTPYIATRNLRKRDDPASFVEADVRTECWRRGLPSPTEVEVLDVGSREVPCPGLGPELHAAGAMVARGEETCVDAWIVRALREVVARAPDSFRGEESVVVCRLVYG